VRVPYAQGMLAKPVAHASFTDAENLLRAGRVTAALDVLLSDSTPSIPALALTLECRLARGEMDLALLLGAKLTHRHGPDADDAVAALACAELAAALGNDDDAVGLALTVGTDDLPWRECAALSMIRVGRRRDAERLATEQLTLARAAGSTYTLARALRTAAAVSATVDHDAYLRESLALARAGGYDRLAAQVATDLAGLQTLTAPDHGDAVTLLRDAEEYADVEDLWPLHTRVRRLLERLGETPKLPRTEAMARLTQTQLLICNLAATGSTNRAIGEHLGITVKAVEWHLSHAYKKLGIRGRSDLPRVLRLP
jgi:DNA-binding NarL/FixJ family response regulator